MNKYKNINKDILKYIILIIIILFISSCSSNLGDKFQKLEEPKEEEAIIYFYRPWKYVSGGIYYTIKDKNNNKVTKMYNGSYYPYYTKKTDEDKQYFSATTETKSEIEIEIKNGEIYFIKSNIGLGILVGKPKFKIITNQEEALKELKQCRIVKNKEDKAKSNKSKKQENKQKKEKQQIEK